MKEAKSINVKNDYYTESFEKLCNELESGEVVRIYVDCIGHTRAEWVEEKYSQELQKKYGEQLKIDDSGWKDIYWLEK